MNPWKPIEADTAWIDGRDVVLFAHDMEVTARFCPGQWSENFEGREYDGPVWSCFDDQFQFEIEVVGPQPTDMFHGPVTHWREPSDTPETPNKGASQ